MEEVRYKRMSKYLLFIVACSTALNVGGAFIVNDQKNMYEDLRSEYNISQKVITDLGNKISEKNTRIQELENQIPV